MTGSPRARWLSWSIASKLHLVFCMCVCVCINCCLKGLMARGGGEGREGRKRFNFSSGHVPSPSSALSYVTLNNLSRGTCEYFPEPPWNGFESIHEANKDSEVTWWHSPYPLSSRPWRWRERGCQQVEGCWVWLEPTTTCPAQSLWGRWPFQAQEQAPPAGDSRQTPRDSA